MRPFDTLIELSENQLDEKRKRLVLLEERLAAARARRSALDEEQAQEQQVASQETGIVGFAYGAYAERLIQRREEADREIEKAGQAVEEQREIVREAFAELKRYEMAHEARLAKARREQEAKDQIEQDEIAGNLLRRRDERL
ncbi:MAG: flagellar FliJ family protein [Alphaproteobacteria bacterium]|nr:flagellar FliJ family protein [Alphaproteobacteria bacterium]